MMNPSSDVELKRRAAPEENNIFGIYKGAVFPSFGDFIEKFTLWQSAKNYHLRKGSSEYLKSGDPFLEATFVYKYVVFQCQHYGQPRQRGEGKRINQSYLPCGCKAMLRLTYSSSQELRITTMREEHTGHELTMEAPKGSRVGSGKLGSKSSKHPVLKQQLQKSPSQAVDELVKLLTSQTSPILSAGILSSPTFNDAIFVNEFQALTASDPDPQLQSTPPPGTSNKLNERQILGLASLNAGNQFAVPWLSTSAFGLPAQSENRSTDNLAMYAQMPSNLGIRPISLQPPTPPFSGQQLLPTPPSALIPLMEGLPVLTGTEHLSQDENFWEQVFATVLSMSCFQQFSNNFLHLPAGMQPETEPSNKQKNQQIPVSPPSSNYQREEEVKTD